MGLIKNGSLTMWFIWLNFNVVAFPPEKEYHIESLLKQLMLSNFEIKSLINSFSISRNFLPKSKAIY